MGLAPLGNTGAEIALDGVDGGKEAIQEALKRERAAWWASALENTIEVATLGLTAYPGAGQELELIAAVEPWLGPAVARAKPARWYTASWSVLGSSFLSVTSERPGEVRVDLSQTDVQGLGAPRLRELIVKLAAWSEHRSLKFSRLDLAYEDRGVLAVPADIHEALEAGNRVSHVRKWRLELGGGDGAGNTAYVGSRQSDEFLRVYDGQVMHGGDVAFTRWELELHDGSADYRAAEIFRLYESIPAMSAEDLAPWFWGCVRRFVDFVDRDSASHVEDMKPLGWWSQLTGMPAKLRRPKVDPVPMTFRQMADWFDRSMGGVLAQLVDEGGRSGHGGWEWLQLVADRGRDRQAYRELVARGEGPRPRVSRANESPAERKARVADWQQERVLGRRAAVLGAAWV